MKMQPHFKIKLLSLQFFFYNLKITSLGYLMNNIAVFLIFLQRVSIFMAKVNPFDVFPFKIPE